MLQFIQPNGNVWFKKMQREVNFQKQLQKIFLTVTQKQVEQFYWKTEANGLQSTHGDSVWYSP